MLLSRQTPLVLSAEPCPDAESLADPDYMLTVSAADELRALWSDSMVSLQHFWQVWQRDYLLLLRERLPYHRGGHTHGQAATAPAVDDIVIIQDTSAPRTHWQLGRVRELILSHDDQVRPAIVETSSKRFLTRPINHLYPLELHATSNTTHADQPLSHSNEQSGTVPPSRPRRAAAQRAMNSFKNLIFRFSVDYHLVLNLAFFLSFLSLSHTSLLSLYSLPLTFLPWECHVLT